MEGRVRHLEPSLEVCTVKYAYTLPRAAVVKEKLSGVSILRGCSTTTHRIRVRRVSKRGGRNATAAGESGTVDQRRLITPAVPWQRKATRGRRFRRTLRQRGTSLPASLPRSSSPKTGLGSSLVVSNKWCRWDVATL